MGSIHGRDRADATESHFRALFGATATLSLIIAGSCVLVLPYAFSQTGIVLGLIICILVAFCNTLTCKLLLRAASKTGHDSYEGIAEALGGRACKVFTQVVLAVLLFGSIVANFAALADCGRRALGRLAKHSAVYHLLADWEGRGIMAALAVFPVLPLCWLKGIRSLELVAAVGNVFLLSLVGLVMHDAVKAGLPAVHNGQLTIMPTPDNLRSLPHAFSVFGFAFYVQPMLLPLLHEMPGGVDGVGTLLSAVRIVIMGVALITYVLLGVFGAARYGIATQPNFLLNKWAGGGYVEGAINATMVLYMSITLPPMLMSLRYTVDIMLAGEDAPYCAQRAHRITLGLLTASVATALCFPAAAESIFAITGAVPVCMACFVIPVAFHFALYQPNFNFIQAGEGLPLLEGAQRAEGDWEYAPLPRQAGSMGLPPVLPPLSQRFWQTVGALQGGKGIFRLDDEAPVKLEQALPLAPHCSHACGVASWGLERWQPCGGSWDLHHLCGVVQEVVMEMVLPAAVALLGVFLGAFSVYDQLVLGMD